MDRKSKDEAQYDEADPRVQPDEPNAPGLFTKDADEEAIKATREALRRFDNSRRRTR
jgi:hypothetical protein